MSGSRIAAARSPSPRSASRPIDAKEHWDPKFEKRKVIQADLKQRLPGLSINMGGATSIDITREGVDKAYGLKKLRDASGIPLDAMMFIGDAIFPGGNDYPAKELGLDTVACAIRKRRWRSSRDRRLPEEVSPGASAALRARTSPAHEAVDTAYGAIGWTIGKATPLS